MGAEPGGPHGYQRCVTRIPYYHLDEDGRLLFCAGALPRVESHLVQAGYRVKVVDRTFCDFFDRANHRMLTDKSMDPWETDFLKHIDGQLRGQIIVRDATSAARQIALLGDFFAKANLFIAAATRQRVATLRRLLGQYMLRPLAVDESQVWAMSPRAHVQTARTFAITNEWDWDVFVFSDVESALARDAIQSMADKRWHAMYCFRELGRRLGDGPELHLESLIGPVVYQPGNPLGPRATVQVLTVSFAGCSSGEGSDSDPLHRKRAMIWRHAERNQLIAAIARGFDSGRPAELARLGLDARIVRRSLRDRRRPEVSILVETLEHARELSQQLPDWELAHAAIDDSQPKPRFATWLTAVPNRAIGTFVRAERTGLPADVVIRADGGIGWPLSLRAFPRRARQPEDHVLLVDIMDGDETGARNAADRRRAYLGAGWDVHDAEAGPCAAAQRPQ